ncbi:MAG: hypothetical protein ACI4SM_06355 [Candidatus Gastranaerophilaceae bacterium]
MDDYILKQNAIFINKSIPDIYDKLSNHILKSNFKVQSSISSYPILEKDGVFLNNFKNPIEECINIFESVPNDNQNLYIIYGLELGCLLNFFKDNTNGAIIVFEDDFDILKYTLSKVNFIKIFSLPKIYLVSCEKELDEVIAHIKLIDGIKNTFVVANDFYIKNRFENFEYIKNKYEN